MVFQYSSTSNLKDNYLFIIATYVRTKGEEKRLEKSLSIAGEILKK